MKRTFKKVKPVYGKDKKKERKGMWQMGKY